MTAPPVPATRSRYPLGVLVVVAIAAGRCLIIAVALSGIERGGGILDWLIGASPIPDFKADPGAEYVAQGVLIGLFVASLLVVIGLLARRRWGWVLAIVTSGCILALDLGWWFAGQSLYSSMLINVIAVFYLNQRDVRLSLRGAQVDP